MTRYKFSQDRKHTIWTRTYFTIDAPTQAEAIAKAAENNDVNSLLNMAGDLFKQNGLSFNNIFSSFMNMRGQR